MKDIANKTDSVDTLPANAFNSMVSEMENVVTDSSQTLDATAETDPDPSPTQISRAITQSALSADYYEDSGAANAYVLTTSGSWRQPTALINGSKFRFIPDNTNTGASTVNVAGLGVKDIRQYDNTPVLAGQLPAGKTVEIYYDSSAGNFKLVEFGLGGGGLGGVNVLEDEANAQNGVANWISSGTTITVAQETSVIPLNGVRDTAFKLIIGGTPNAGDYVGLRFPMPTALKDHTVGWTWFQQLASYTANAIKIEAYYNSASDYSGAFTEVPLTSDDTSGDTYPPNQNGEIGGVAFTDEGNSYYEIRFIVTASAVGGETLYGNDLKIGTDNIAVGANVSAVDWAPTYTGFGTPTQEKYSAERSFKWVTVQGTFNPSANGGVSAAIHLPAGLTIDASEYTTQTNRQVVGKWHRLFSGAATGVFAGGLSGVLFYDGSDTSKLYFSINAASSQLSKDLDSTVSNTDPMTVEFKIPITEWRNSGAVYILSDNVVNANERFSAHGVASAKVIPASTVTLIDVWNNTYSNPNFDGTTYTVKSTGRFRVASQLRFGSVASSSTQVQVFVNGSIVAVGVTDQGANEVSVRTDLEIDLTVGDTIQVKAYHTGGTTLNNSAYASFFSVSRMADFSAGYATGFARATADHYGLVKETDGSYVPSYNSGLSTNIASFSGETSYYEKVNNTVRVWGSFAATVTTTGILSEIVMTTPIDRSSNFASVQQAVGTSHRDAGGATDNGHFIKAYTSDSNKVLVKINAPAAGSQRYFFQFVYTLN